MNDQENRIMKDDDKWWDEIPQYLFAVHFYLGNFENEIGSEEDPFEKASVDSEEYLFD